MNLLAALSIPFLLSIPVADSYAMENRCNVNGLADITPFADGIMAVTWGYESVLYFESDNSAMYIPWIWDESRCCSSPSSFGDSAAICINTDGVDNILFFSPDSIIAVYGPYERGGRPAFDGLGNLWFTADGYLFRNGISTGTELDSYTVSVDQSGSWIVFCDESDRVCILNTAERESTVLASGYRFYNPVFVIYDETLVIISPTLEGEIIAIAPSTGVCKSLASGSQPFWWKEAESILYSVTSDNGHTITSGEIWIVSLEGVNRQISFTSEIHETHPIAVLGTVYAIDADTGSLVAVPSE